MKEKKIKVTDLVKIQDLKEVVSLITYQEGIVVATKNGIYTNVKSLLSSIKER